MGEISSITRQMIRGSQNYDARLGIICGCGTTIGKRSTNEDVHDIRLNEAVPLVDDDGRVRSMRAFWEPERTMATYRAP